MTKFQAVLNAQTLLTHAVTMFPGMMCEICVYKSRVRFTLYVPSNVTLKAKWIRELVVMVNAHTEYRLLTLEGCEHNALQFNWETTDD